MQFIDTHSHIFSSEFASDIDAVISRTLDKGVNKLILPAIDSSTHNKMFECVDKYPCCYAAIGLHPTSVRGDFLEELSIVENYLNSSRKFYAIGEIGLDLYWSDEFFEEQKQVFIKQLDLSLKYSLPVILHTREAFNEMFEILSMPQYHNISGVFHGFSENMEIYKKMSIFENFFFGVGGVSTFKNSKLAEALYYMDINRILLETDCPYLTPVPYRGKRNESSYIPIIAEKIASIKGISIDEVAKITTLSAEKLFNLNDI